MGSSLVSFRSPLRSHFSEAALGRPVQAPGHPTPPPNLRPPASLTFRSPCVVSHYPNVPRSLSIYLIVGCSPLCPSPPPPRSSFEGMCCVCSQFSQGLREVLDRNFLGRDIQAPIATTSHQPPPANSSKDLLGPPWLRCPKSPPCGPAVSPKWPDPGPHPRQPAQRSADALHLVCRGQLTLDVCLPLGQSSALVTLKSRVLRW